MEIQLNLRVGGLGERCTVDFGVQEILRWPLQGQQLANYQVCDSRGHMSLLPPQAGRMECRILTVLVTDYCPWERENKQVSSKVHNCSWSCAEVCVCLRSITGSESCQKGASASCVCHFLCHNQRYFLRKQKLNKQPVPPLREYLESETSSQLSDIKQVQQGHVEC